MSYFEQRHERNFFAKVVKQVDGCWAWTAAVNQFGYGRFSTWDAGRSKHWLAHRWAYELLVGPIPEGLHLDHLCRNRACVNPDHLEPVSARVNVLRSEALPAQQMRQTRCLRGHALSGDNLYVRRNKRGSLIRHCRECRRQRLREFRQRQRDVAG